MPETSEIKGSNNSRGGMNKKEMGQIRTKKMQCPSAYPLKIERIGHFRRDIPGWDKPGTFIPVVSTT